MAVVDQVAVVAPLIHEVVVVGPIFEVEVVGLIFEVEVVGQAEVAIAEVSVEVGIKGGKSFIFKYLSEGLLLIQCPLIHSASFNLVHLPTSTLV